MKLFALILIFGVTQAFNRECKFHASAKSSKEHSDETKEIMPDQLITLSLNEKEAQERINLEIEHGWNNFKMTHSKQYANNEEEIKRKEIFKTNLKMIQSHNDRFNKGTETFAMGINKFTDMTSQEFKDKYLNYKPLDTLPIDMMKDIEFENDCIAFCRPGCEGCDTPPAFKYIKKHGINFEKNYKYLATNSSKCKAKPKFNAPKIIKQFRVLHNDEKLYLKQLRKTGPIEVGVCADHWKHYKHGIFTAKNCGCSGPNHSVVIVGAKKEYGEKLWFIRNSWGTDWGIAGHANIRMYENACDIAEEGATYIIV
uniref:CSON002914 protein n=1 Tax=Culicoides sonorensis TaxID=179676 RepID=A0A336MM66_CULSO